MPAGFSADAGATDKTGEAVIYNVLPGMSTITVTPLAVGKPSAVATVFTQAQAITSYFAYPNQ